MVDALIAIILRVSLLCVIGIAVTWLLRHASPVLRHRVWTVVIGGSLLIPVLLVVSPVIYLPVEGQSAPVQPGNLAERPQTASEPVSPTDSPASLNANSVAPVAELSPPARLSHNGLSEQVTLENMPTPQTAIEIPLLIFWLTGVLVMIVRGIWQFYRLDNLMRSSHMLTDSNWLRLCETLSDSIGLHRQVVLAQSRHIDVPFTWGLQKPSILLPAASSRWSDDWRRMILLHELIHVQRRDTLVNCLAWLVQTVHWFNPLIWFACQRLSVEAEHATDAHVLACDVNPLNYASLLVDFARHSSFNLVPGGTGMIHQTTLKSRVEHILRSTTRDTVSTKSSQWLIALILMSGIILMGGIKVVTVAAQSSEITLTVTLIEGMEYLEDARIFEQFEEANPDVRVNVIYQESLTGLFPSPVDEIDAHLDGVDDYTLTGDVLVASAGGFLPPEVSLEATQAGYFLDLNPLIQADASFDASVFYPSIWESVSWSGGTWLLPLAAEVYTVVYEPEVFDTAGLSYPDADWNTESYINAIQTLTVSDSTSNTTVPGYIGFNRSDYAFMYSLLGQGVMDDTSGLLQPTFTDPQTLAFAERWGNLFATGAIFNPSYTYPDDFDPFEIPLRTSRLQETIYTEGVAALMPGARSGLSVSGLAVSSRTQHPEAAYQLALYLANDVRVADALENSYSMTTKAKPSYAERDEIDGAPYIVGELSQENQLLLEQAIDNAVPVSDLFFFNYFRSVLRQTVNTDRNIQAALEEAEALARDNLRIASERQNDIAGIVVAPTPSFDLQSGEIALNFGLDSATGNSNPTVWNRFIEDFIETDPDVGAVILDARSITIDRATETYDCFYLPFNAVPVANLEAIINLEPLTSTDRAFDRDNFWSGILQQVERDNQIRAYPIDMYPLLVWYDESRLSDISATGQTIQEFYTTLNAQVARNGDEPVLAALNTGTTLLMLIAADGSLPLDFRQQPPAIDFTGHVPAIQRVLDLAKNGVIHYDVLTTLTGRNTPDMPPIAVQPWRSGIFDPDGYTPALFPQGNRYMPAAFELGTAYISQSTSNPEACYRFIRRMSQQPDLFRGIPVQHTSATTQVSDFQMLAPQLENVLASPGTVVFPYSVRGGAARDIILSYWLYRAFDRYVLEDANLQAELAEAERFSQEYLTCVDNLPAYDPAAQSSRERNRQYRECAIQVDPSSRTFFSPGGD